jgi:hypothetical protein
MLIIHILTSSTVKICSMKTRRESDPARLAATATPKGRGGPRGRILVPCFRIGECSRKRLRMGLYGLGMYRGRVWAEAECRKGTDSRLMYGMVW